MLDESDLAHLLSAQFGYPPSGARLVAAKLVRSLPPVRAALQEFLATSKTPALSVEGYSVERLAREHGMKPIAALLTLDWLMREPDVARASLSRGHDTVSH